MAVTTTRRTFLKTVGALGALAAAGGAAASDVMFSQAETALAEPEEKTIWSHCGVNCGCTCALQFHVKDGAIAYVESDNTGSSAYDAPQARACLRGRSIRRWLQSPDRLDYPLKRTGARGSGEYERISWEEALDTVASELKRVYETYGPEAVYVPHGTGTYVGKIQEHGVKRLLAATGGFLKYYGNPSFHSVQTFSAPFTYGSGHVDDGNFTAMQPNQLALLFACSPADTRMSGAGHGHYLQQQIEEKNVHVINVDYRLNDTLANWGGEWVPIRPGTDGALVAALAHEIIVNDWVKTDFLHKYCVGYDEETMPESAKGQNKSYKDYIMGTGYDMVEKTPAWASEITQIPEDRIKDLAKQLAEADTVFIGQGAGIQRRDNGEQTSRSIMILPWLLGQVGRPGTYDGNLTDAWPDNMSKYSIQNMPTGKNAVKTAISFFTLPQAVADPDSMTDTTWGVRNAKKLNGGIKFMFSYANNCFTNQFGDINKVHDILADEKGCEFIVASDVFLSDSAKYADIILPDLTLQEQLSIANQGYADPTKNVFYGSAVYEPKAERRSIYDVCTDLADRFGVKDEFTDGGKTQEDVLKGLYEDYRKLNPEAPTWEEGYKMGVWHNNPQPFVARQAFVEDPEANPLPTPSGKVEIYSEQLAKIIDEWTLPEGDVLTPIPVFDPGHEGYKNLTDEHPLLVTAFHYKAHTHSSYTPNTILEQEAPCWLWMNPVDAEKRGIEDGDEVRVYNTRGEVRKKVKVTHRIVPGTVAMPTGSAHDANMAGDRVDKGGCINTLTHIKPNPYGKGNGVHSAVGQVEKVGA